MATAQQVIDEKYALLQKQNEYQEMVNEEKLRELVSPIILTHLSRTQGINELNGLKNFAGVLNLSYHELTEIKGLTFLESITELHLYKNKLTTLSGLESLKNLTRLVIGDNPLLNDVGNISELVNLTYIDTMSCQLTTIGSLGYLANLVTVYINNNQLTEIGRISSLTSLDKLFASANNFSTPIVDNILADMKAAKDAGAPLTVLQLNMNSIPTGGALNPNYIDLVNAGVAVTIDT